MAFTEAALLEWHEGEDQMHKLLKVPEIENPTSFGLTPFGERILRKAPLLALGTLDDDGRPWTTLWGGEAGFAQPLSQSVLGFRTMVDDTHDPVLRILSQPEEASTGMGTQRRRPVSALSIDLATRTRLKISGEMVASAVEHTTGHDDDRVVAEAQLIIAVKNSLGNCPKYLNAKQIESVTPAPSLLSDIFPLGEKALNLLAKADLFFITSDYHGILGTNHRGGPSGFVRVLHNDPSSVVLVYPEYSGNRLYQTLGNLKVNPKAGVVIPDFDNGDVLYLSCETDIVFGKEAAALLPRSNLAVKLSVTHVRFVTAGLAFRGRNGLPSPYNPTVRYLTSERKRLDATNDDMVPINAILVARHIVTPTIARLRFKIGDPSVAEKRRPAQYAIFNLEDELSLGYSHMRNDDPKSLNDDFVRSFTVSSPVNGVLPYDEFEIMMRNVGKATKFLFNQQPRNRIEIPLKGFAGDFNVERSSDGFLPFVAGGIGITPLLAYLPGLDLTNLRLFWTLHARDLGLVEDIFRTWPKLAPSTLLFITGSTGGMSLQTSYLLETLKKQGAGIHSRRMTASDLTNNQSLSQTWYICTGKSMRLSLLEWLKGKIVVHEDFDY